MLKIAIILLMKIYFVGIKGTGMSALALVYKNLGYEVVGSDVKEYFFTQESLLKNKIKFYENFSEENIKKELPIKLAIVSNAWQNNIETQFLKKLKIKTLTYPEGVARIFNKSFGIAVCGTHGKTTTTAFLGKIFELAKKEVTVLVGSPVKDWGGPVYFSGKKFFILEADEYKNAFLNYKPKVIILTSLDYDHPDFFKTKKEYKESFLKFFRNLEKPSILISYHKFKLPKRIKQFKVKYNKNLKFDFFAPGDHWQKNLQLVYKFCELFNLQNQFHLATKNFKGPLRRFDILSHDPLLIDDYGHTPEEVRAFYKSLEEKFKNKKIYFIFQPHTYTRTKFLFKKFLKTFKEILSSKNIQKLIIFKTFSSAREKSNEENRKVEEKLKNISKKLKKTLYFESEENLLKFLKKIKNYNNKLIATCGAGNIYKVLFKIKN